MLAKSLISEKIPAVKSDALGVEILNIMEVNEVSYIPCIENNIFLGLIFKNEITKYSLENKAIKNFNFPLIKQFVYDDQHIFEVIEKFVKLSLQAIAVFNRDNEYFGIISTETLINGFSKLTSMQEPGALIVIEMNANNYSLHEISQIVEGNDAKILTLYIETQAGSNTVELTLKVNTTNLSPIMQAFERFNYSIKSTYFEDEQMNNFYMNRYDEFMHYINIS